MTHIRKDFQVNRADGQNLTAATFEAALLFLAGQAGAIRQRPAGPQPPRKAGEARPWPVVYLQNR